MLQQTALSSILPLLMALSLSRQRSAAPQTPTQHPSPPWNGPPVLPSPGGGGGYPNSQPIVGQLLLPLLLAMLTGASGTNGSDPTNQPPRLTDLQSFAGLFPKLRPAIGRG